MAKADIRDVAPLLQKVRNFLLGREHSLALRFEKDISVRSAPPPDLPDGPCHKLSANYYCGRDARREVAPPELVASGTKLLGKPTASEALESCTPGKVYRWD